MRLFTRRRLLASVAGSLLLHALLVVDWPGSRTPDSPPRPSTVEVAIETVAASSERQPRVAMVGQHPSGRGKALAGSNPRRDGSPLRARRFESARGRASGPGQAGMVADLVTSVTAPPGALETAAVPAATSAPEAIPTPPPGSPQTTTEETPQPPAAPEVDADRAFDELARAQRLRLSKGDGGGRAGAGSGGGGIGLGLVTELSGRQVPDSPVVTAPVVVEGRPVECELPATLRLLTIVHVLVTRDGSAAVPRVLRSSGYSEFDRCALRYVVAMRFAPGLDDRAHPLDVWMNVRVSPVSASQVGSAK